MFWTSEKLKERAAKETLLIKPYYESRVKHGAYELSLGNEAFITSDDKKTKQVLEDGEQVVIPSGQLALLITKEEIQVPHDAIGFISIKAGIKFSGLVNVSGFHVDPGFSGKLKFSVYNAGSRDTVLSNGQNVFLIWFCDLDRKTSDPYKGDHANQKEISSQDVMKLLGEVHSPAALDKRLISLEHSVSTIKWIVITLFVAAITGTIGYLAKNFVDGKAPSSQVPILENRTLNDSGGKTSVVSPLRDGQQGTKPETTPETLTETKSQPASASSSKEHSKADKETVKRKAETGEKPSQNTSSDAKGGNIKNESGDQRSDGK
jgi:dCTP deaminase